MPVRTKHSFGRILQHALLLVVLFSLTGSHLPHRSPDAYVGEALTSKRASFRAVTYNIIAGDGGKGLRGVADVLRATNADIIALQEVDKGTRRSGRVDQPRRLAKLLGMHHVFREHFKFKTGGYFGLALLSRHPIKQVRRHSVADSSLAILEATVAFPAANVKTYVVHFHPYANPLGDEVEATNRARRAELEKTRQLADKGSKPALVMGDFNTLGAELSEEFVDACSRAGPTWPTSSPKVPKAVRWIAGISGVRIDYIWASKDRLTVLDCYTVDTDASDHRPVVADLRLR